MIMTFLGVVINLPGGIHFNPILLHFFEPKKVLLLTSFVLLMGALSRAWVFRKEVIRADLLQLIILGFAGGMVGGYLVNYIPEKVVVVIFIFSGLKYIYEFYKLKKHSAKIEEESKFKKYLDLSISGFLASFTQALGISVGTIRQGYYFKRGYSLPQVHATVAWIFIASNISTIGTRYFNEHFDPYLFLQLLPLFPLMLITTALAKKILYKIPKIWQDRIIIYSLVVSLLSIIPILLK